MNDVQNARLFMLLALDKSSVKETEDVEGRDYWKNKWNRC